MIGKAQNADIHISWKIQIPEQMEISTFDINVILSNLLDNALNALEDIPNPNLEILMKYDRGLLCISIQNDCSHEQAAIFHAHSVFKPDDEHGYGLKNVRRIVEKYHGSLTTECVNDFFHASVLLFLSDMGRTDFADIQNKKECGGNRQWQRRFLRNWAANTSGKEIT